MVQHGTVVNGVIVPDGPPPPDGTRVVFQAEAAGDDAGDWENAPPPPATETREEYLESLRRSIAAMDAGEKGKSVAEVFDEIDRELNRPANGG